MINVNNLIKKAKEILADYPDSAHITFILKRTTIICWGINQKYKTAPLAQKFGYRFHAIHSELAALKSFPRFTQELKNCKIVNIRIKKCGKVGLSKPCKLCQRLLWFFGIQSIIYSTGNANEFNWMTL